MSAAPERAGPNRLATAPGTEDPAFRRFLEGDGATVRGAATLAASIVRFRGYYVPAQERADLEQDVLLHLWRAIAAPGFSFSNSFDGLVRAITYRRCIDWRRLRRASAPLDSEPIDGGEPADVRLLHDERKTLGWRVLEGLRAPCRELFRLHAVEGLGYREIAAATGRSEVALRGQMSACLKEARARLARLETGHRPEDRSRRTR